MTHFSSIRGHKTDFCQVSNERVCVSIHHEKLLTLNITSNSSRDVMGHHDGCYDMMFHELIDFFLTKMT